MVESGAGVFAVLTGICAFFFWLEAKTRWVVFRYFPPLLFIYAVPVVLNNIGILPGESDAYVALQEGVLPAFIVLMLVSVDLRSALKSLGRGIGVMLFGSAGISLGAAASYALVRGDLDPQAWKLFGALSGAWIGGTGNMAAVAAGVGLEPSDLGVAILADNVVYVVWLPILLSSKALSPKFAKWIRLEGDGGLSAARATAEPVAGAPSMVEVAYLAATVAAVTAGAHALAGLLPELPPVVSRATWKTLLITTAAIGLSFTRLRQISLGRPVGLYFVYLYLAGMGARASIAGLDDAPLFLAAAFLWVAIHGAMCLLGAAVFRVDLRMAAIASAANIGGAASAPVVAAHHDEALVPASILMALLGYAVGNYLAVATTQLCYWVAGA